MLRFLAFLPLLAIITACDSIGGAPITTPPVEVKFDADPGRPPAKLDAVTIRTYKFREGEVVGASCVLNGTGYSSSFTTPAVVQLPLFLGRTDDAFVRCSNNQGAGQAVLEAENLSAPENEGLTISTGTAGTRVSALFSIRNRAKDRFNYPSFLRITLR